jgi:hypothetical protein
MCGIILENRFREKSESFTLLPKLPVFWALHLNEEVQLVLECAVKFDSIVAI